MHTAPEPQILDQAHFEFGQFDSAAELGPCPQSHHVATVVPFEHGTENSERLRIFNLFLPLVPKWVASFVSNWPQADRWECASAATNAVWLAAGIVETNRDAREIAAYIRTAVTSRMIHALRLTTGVSRSTVRINKRLSLVRERLSSELGRAPTISEVARDVGISPSAVRAADHRLTTPVPIQGSFSGDWDRDTGDNPREAIERAEAHTALRAAMALLPMRMRQVIQISYFEGKTFADVGRQLGVSRARVTLLHQQALGRLRGVSLAC